MDFLAGEIVCFDKPLDWTSFDLVNKFRYLLSRRLKVKKIKVGHAGTLDPKATGVLSVCTGKATKRIDEFQYQTKEYVATLQLGATTPSFDLEKEIDCTYPTGHITRELVEQTLTTFVGTIRQVPPVFSACKVGGGARLRAGTQRRRSRLKSKDACYRRVGTAGIRASGHQDTGSMQQRNVYPCVGTRHRDSSPFRSASDRLATYAYR